MRHSRHTQVYLPLLYTSFGHKALNSIKQIKQVSLSEYSLGVNYSLSLEEIIVKLPRKKHLPFIKVFLETQCLNIRSVVIPVTPKAQCVVLLINTGTFVITARVIAYHYVIGLYKSAATMLSMSNVDITMYSLVPASERYSFRRPFLVFRYQKIWILSACRIWLRFWAFSVVCNWHDKYSWCNSFSKISEKCGFLNKY